MTVHTITRYPTLLGIITPWDGLHLGFVGDVVGNMAQPVKFPSTAAFDLIAAVRMPTVGMMEAQWVAMAGALFLAPLAAGDANTKLIRMRHVALLPFVTMHRCLAPLTMRQLWALLGQPLVDSGRTVEMGVLLDWIHVASVEPATQVPPLVQMATPPVTPLADGSLLGYLSQVIQWWLPGLLVAPAPPAGSACTTGAQHPPADGR